MDAGCDNKTKPNRIVRINLIENRKHLFLRNEQIFYAAQIGGQIVSILSSSMHWNDTTIR